ncbi:ABC-2 type transport system permease protein [Hamadaea flava]|uniref:ABC transporter permease n=1 Tax=Hamadaea flava TaxID=1742688 RepID=A0ABV8LUW8_9ACTN|nr:ABC-2 family transporter protein [Hamadaea flava]MCP2327825.1 ABC-2 type transport system permease protein [Hamadaea flava]
MADRPYVALALAQVRSQASYRVSFWLDMAGNLVVLSADLMAMLVMFQVTDDLGGFSRPQVLLMFAITAVAFALADLAVGNIERIRVYVRTGTLDTVLVRPLGVLGQLLAVDFSIRRLSRVLYAAVILAVALHAAHLAWTVPKAVLLLIAIVAGALFFAALFVASATVAFWWIESGELGNIVTYGGRDFTAYPMSLYGAWFRRLFGFVLGLGFISYYPALALLGRPDPIGLPDWTGWVAPLAGPIAATVAALIWRTGVRHYRSTGS